MRASAAAADLSVLSSTELSVTSEPTPEPTANTALPVAAAAVTLAAAAVALAAARAAGVAALAPS